MATNINQAFIEVLSDYGGTVDDRRKRFLEEYYPTITGTLNDIEYKILDDLGYEGAINDKWAEYLNQLEYLAGMGDKGRLLPDTFYSFRNPDYYTYYAEDIQPVLVLDFENNVYLTRDLQGSDYEADSTTPILVLDFENDFYGTRDLLVGDYSADGTDPILVLDIENDFYGAN